MGPSAPGSAPNLSCKHQQRERRERVMEGSQKLGIVRMYALVFGLAYLAVAALEVGLKVFGSGSLMVGSQTILKITPAQNAIHWLVGLAVLGSLFAATAIAKMGARGVGVVVLLA